MVYLISGTTHVGKTFIANKLMNEKHISCMSMDHIKMGLIRSGYIKVKPTDEDELIMKDLWPVVKEIIKTVIENRQDLIIEGCYIPFNYKSDFEKEYLDNIKYICLCFSENYINNNYSNIMKNENIIESRIDDGYCTKELLIEENKSNIDNCIKYNLDYLIINEDYNKEIKKIGEIL